MRDFIWTLIIIWTIYQLSSLFSNRKKVVNSHTANKQTASHKTSETSSKTRLRKASDNEGDYVDFEEIK